MPFGAHGGGKDTVFGFWEGSEGVLDVAFEAGVCGFEDGEIVEAGVDLEFAALGALFILAEMINNDQSGKKTSCSLTLAWISGLISWAIWYGFFGFCRLPF